jgi:hypothetical protein
MRIALSGELFDGGVQRVHSPLFFQAQPENERQAIDRDGRAGDNFKPLVTRHVTYKDDDHRDHAQDHIARMKQGHRLYLDNEIAEGSKDNDRYDDREYFVPPDPRW